MHIQVDLSYPFSIIFLINIIFNVNISLKLPAQFQIEKVNSKRFHKTYKSLVCLWKSGSSQKANSNELMLCALSLFGWIRITGKK